MSGDLLTDGQLQLIRWRHLDGVLNSFTDAIRAGADFVGWEAVAESRQADRASLLAHIEALSRRIAALNARNALPCPKCGHKRVPE